MYKAFSMLNEFCISNDIDYAVTGTSALEIQGMCPDDYKVHDIDVHVLNISQEASAKLREMQKLAGLTSKYEGPSITIKVNDVTVNLMPPTKNDTYIEIVAKDGATYKVQTAICALKDKMALQRSKDKDFLLNLIAKLTSL